MRICVLNGSPKGDYSITLHTVLYIQKNFPECEFEVIHVGQKIRAIEKDIAKYTEPLLRADMILFSYPVYTFIAPYQLHRFIELIKSSGIDISGKYAAQITTSKHFYDVTAHNYVKENCFDMGLKYIGGLSADMDDLLTETGRGEAIDFWKYVMFSVENDIYETPPAKRAKAEEYVPTLKETEKKPGFDTVILTNKAPDDAVLQSMIDDFCKVYPYGTRVINIAEYPFSGGCLGCFNCAIDGGCIYKDGFDKYLREEIQTANAIVYAFTVKDHSMGASFKRYDDRQFCNGHRTVTMGMPMGYIVNGDIDNEPNLKMIIEGRCDVGHNFYAGIGNDASGIETMSKKLCYALENKLVLPQMFLGVGGLKIFRDLIYLMGGMMKADHKFYKEHGFYDFPQKKKGIKLKMYLVGFLLGNKNIKSKMGNKMNEGMIAPYKKIINSK